MSHDELNQTIAANLRAGFPTLSGIQFDLLHPTPEMICIVDIAAGISKECRFNGQIPCFYSVAQHSMIVSRLAPPEHRLAALLHDASEAYCKDVVKPLKMLIKELYTPIEENIQRAIFTAFGLDMAVLPEIKRYDLECYRAEREKFRNKNNDAWIGMCLQVNIDTKCWSPEHAEKMFLREFNLITGQYTTNDTNTAQTLPL